MNTLQEWLARAAKDLEIRVVFSHVVILSNGKKIVSEALFPDFGNPLGTLVFCSKNNISASTRYELVAKGYGMSTFLEPHPKEVFDIESYAEMFSDWGWIGNEKEKPNWMT